MKSQYAPSLQPPRQGHDVEAVRRQLAADVNGLVRNAIAQVDAAYARKIAQLEAQVEFLLSRTHNLNTSAMAVLYLLMQRGVFTQSELVSAATQLEGAMDLDRAMSFLRDLDSRLAKRKGAQGEPPPGA